MLSIESLPYLISVVECGGFSAAADQLNCATSTVSRHIQQLEKDLGSALFIRHTRKLSLTEEGRIVYERGLEICSQIDMMESAVFNRHQEISGLVKISAPHWMCDNYIAPCLPKLHQKWPKLSISTTIEAGYIDPYLAEHDIYICVTKPKDSSLIMRPFHYPEFWLVASPEYLKNKAPLNSAEDLHHHDILGLKRSNKHATWSFKHRDKEDVETFDTSGAWFTYVSTGIGYKTCLNGGGLCVVPRAQAEHDVRQGLLRRLLVQYSWSTLGEDQDSYIVYTKESAQSPRVKAVIEHILDNINS
ncbi:LysR family transcriptional regulator [Vibrio sp. S4M6]|uniref:LysR family transcriptional regulator n=1 Tax=Vibrio sinus TaxID=2946865 RepID=UPI00202A567E|nr:LysR family transcriptional regulator [Vibrio sinus]MCL9780288.1 LysR family transcriptional regulator [Vibrio sinus]